VAHRILRDLDAAEDAVQRALLDIWRDLPLLRDIDRFDAWAYRLVVRASLDEARQRRRHAHVRELLPEGPAIPDSSGSIATRDALDSAFERLSPEHRAVVVLHHYAGFPLTEIAAILGVPYGTVGSRLHYALRELRAALGADEAPAAAQKVAAPGRPVS
jgi:RNA polymerase sigma-70 factor (ECF subfamily)